MAKKLITFSSRSNAKRAAEKAIDDGSAPSIDYGLRTHASGRFEIVWKDRLKEAPELLGAPPAEVLAAAEEERELDDVAEGSAEPITNPSDGEGDMPDIFPPGTRVIVQVGARKRRAGAVDYRVDARSCRIKFDDPFPSVLFRYNQLSLDVDYRDGSEPLRPAEKLPRKPRAAPAGDRKPSRKVEFDMRAAQGEMPTKPIMTSKANPHYQKRFDQLEKWAMAGDWNAIRGYEVKGINSYAKMLKQYRDRLLVAHDASSPGDVRP